MDNVTSEKANDAQFAGIALPPDADFDKSRQFAHDLARQEFDAVDGDRKAAHSTLMKMIESRPDVAERLLFVAFDELWQNYLHQCSKYQRRRIGRNVVNINGEEPNVSGVRKDDAPENQEPWSVPDTLGEGLVAKRQNMDVIYDYQFPYLGKNIGSATKFEFASALRKVEARRDVDSKLIELGEAVQKRIAKADKDAVIQDIVSAEELVRLFRQSGVVT